jgi:hypothetical protein
MDTKGRLLILFLVLYTMVGRAVVGRSAPTGTTFNYQGQLDDNGPAQGGHDFTFKIYDALTGGNQLGGTVQKEDILVENGYFSASLDFGSGVFTGQRRWLEIGVRQGDSNGPFETFSPRTELMPTPYALFALDGTAGSASWAVSGNNIYNTNRDNVGIGTTSPAGKLHVESPPIHGDIAFYDAGSGQNDLHVDPASGFTGDTDRIYVVQVSYSSGNPDKFKWSDDAAATWSSDTLDMSTDWINLSNGVWIKWDNVDGHYDGAGSMGDRWQWTERHGYDDALVVRGGNVGIGTSNPDAKVEVANGQMNAKLGYHRRGGPPAYGDTYTAVQGTCGDDLRGDLGRRFDALGGTTGYGLYGSAKTPGTNYGVYGQASGGSTNWAGYFNGNVYASDSIGIGTTDPRSALSIGSVGTLDTSIYCDGRAVGVVGRGLKVGVRAVGEYGLRAEAYGHDLAPAVGVSVDATGYDNGDGYAVFAKINRAGTGRYWSGYFASMNRGGTYGGLYADYRTGGAIDLAEYILDTCGDTEPGDVLVADPDNDESVIKACKRFDSTVVGIVSTDPHMIIGIELIMDEETGQMYENINATQLALAGRVPVKVTDENGPIRRGDLLTTSSKSGHAMKWTLLDVERAGDFEELKSILMENERRRHAVLGKALEPHASGDGKVVALITLQ